MPNISKRLYINTQNAGGRGRDLVNPSGGNLRGLLKLDCLRYLSCIHMLYGPANVLGHFPKGGMSRLFTAALLVLRQCGSPSMAENISKLCSRHTVTDQEQLDAME